ncbi:MAG: HD domain-containing protein [Chloroflexi bacterium]|nr:HD domain-containing protein [Chloroflexota bacterium]
MAGMTACACVPLKTAEATVGLLHLAFRSKRAPTEGETRLLTSIAEMAGNALHRATLHEQTERDAVELALAYDTTLAGWARALELRDEDTEGHTRRVTEMTLQLARAVGLKESELLHIRRGALLHDMGKMGVPDHILLKPGPLTDEEWIIMRQHPQSAYDMLAPIAYLRPALDIPYCHHEKWDGAGYPRGLKGEQIPFAARIFAVVDVWDALRSDRPYREAWPEEKVREYIREQAGKHFDPRVVEVFQELDTSHA